MSTQGNYEQKVAGKHMKPLIKDLAVLAVPILLFNILSMGVKFADNIMVGQLGEVAAAGVLMALNVQTILNTLAMGITATIVVLAAQYWGKGDIESVKKIVAIGVQTALAIGLFVSTVCIIFPAMVLRIFTNDAHVIYDGVLYLRIVAFSYIFFCLTQTLVGAMRSVEIVRIGIVISFISLFFSIVGNYALIFGNFGLPALGVQGAALATLFARIFEAGAMIAYVRFFDKRLLLRFGDFFHNNAFHLRQSFFKHGLPVIGGDVSWGIIATIKIAVIGRLGDSAMAAASISAILFAAVSIIVWSVSGAGSVIIGKTVGSGDTALVRRHAVNLQLIFAVIGIFTSLIIFALRTPFMSLYNFNTETLAIASQFISITGAFAVFTAYHASCFTGIIRAGGDTKFVFIVDSLCSWLFVLPLTFIAAFIIGAPPWVVYICIFSDQFFKWIIAIVKVNRFKWIINLTRE